jgi:hypothetical protein
MQQSGSFPSQPVGQGPCEQSFVGHPPKQRGMPFMSYLQTSFLPLQQFWDALAFRPQMSPGGLHEPPLSQTWSVGSHWIHCEDGTR